jgi:hypothetical protein
MLDALGPSITSSRTVSQHQARPLRLGAPLHFWVECHHSPPAGHDYPLRGPFPSFHRVLRLRHGVRQDISRTAIVYTSRARSVLVVRPWTSGSPARRRPARPACLRRRLGVCREPPPTCRGEARVGRGEQPGPSSGGRRSTPGRLVPCTRPIKQAGETPESESIAVWITAADDRLSRRCREAGPRWWRWPLFARVHGGRIVWASGRPAAFFTRFVVAPTLGLAHSPPRCSTQSSRVSIGHGGRHVGRDAGATGAGWAHAPAAPRARPGSVRPCDAQPSFVRATQGTVPSRSRSSASPGSAASAHHVA